MENGNFKINGRIGAIIALIKTWWAAILGSGYLGKSLAENFGANRWVSWSVGLLVATATWFIVQSRKDGLHERDELKKQLGVLTKVLSDYRTDYHKLKTDARAVLERDAEYYDSLINDPSVSPDLKSRAKRRKAACDKLVRVIEESDHTDLLKMLYEMDDAHTTKRD